MSNEFIDKLKDSLPSLLETLGADFKKKTNNELGGPCLYCGGDDRCTLFIDSDTFFCRQCDEKGDSIDYHKHIWGISSLAELAKHQGIESNSSQVSAPAKKNNKKKSYKKGAWNNSKEDKPRVKKYFSTRKIFFDDKFPVPPSIHYSSWIDKATKDKIRSILFAVTNLNDKKPEATARTFLDSNYEKLTMSSFLIIVSPVV